MGSDSESDGVNPSSELDQNESSDSRRSSGGVSFDPFETGYHHRLGVPIDASQSVVREQGKKATTELHPDNTGGGDDEDFIRISDARKTLEDPDEREIYQLFCLNFGVEQGTEMYESWEQRGRPSTPAKIITNELPGGNNDFLPLSALEDHTPLPAEPPARETFESESEETTETKPEPDVNGGGSRGTSDDSDHNRVDFTGGASFESKVESQQSNSDPHTRNDNVKSGSGTPSLNDQMNLILNESTPEVVRTTVDDGVSVSSVHTGSTIELVDFYNVPVFFDLTEGDVFTSESRSPPVDVVDLNEKGKYRFELPEPESDMVVVDVFPPSSQPNTPSSGKVSNTPTQGYDSAQRETPERSSRQTDDVDSYVSQFLDFDDPGIIELIFLLLDQSSGFRWFILRAVFSIVWIGVGVSGLLTELGAIGWLILVLPFRKTGLYAVGGLTFYMSLDTVLFGYGFPDGEMKFPLVVAAFLISIYITLSVDFPNE